MTRDRAFWYAFLAELGFLILPCGFNSPHSHTFWLFDATRDSDEVPWLSDRSFRVAHTHVYCFFYRINANRLKQWLPLMQLTDRLIRARLAQRAIRLDAPEMAGAGRPPTIAKYDGKPYLQGFSLLDYLAMISVIAGEIDPLDRADRPGRFAEYLLEFDTYGLCFLSIARAHKEVV